VSQPAIGLEVDQEYEDGGIGIRVDEYRIGARRAANPPVAAGPHIRPGRAGLRMVPDSPREDRNGVTCDFR
jgi:hypothetical protein